MAVAVPLVALAIFTATYATGEPASAAAPGPGGKVLGGDLVRQHNVYFIVLDAYARADSLREVLDFDNTPFLDAMRERGFYVADRSFANFPITFLSISTTLNMAPVVGPGQGVIGHQQRYSVMMGGFNNTVARFRKLGYGYLHAPGGGWGGTVCRGAEDHCISGRAHSAIPELTEMEVSLLKLTPAFILLKRFVPDFVQYDRLSLTEVVTAVEKVAKPPFFLFHHNLEAHSATYTADCIPRRDLDPQFRETVADHWREAYRDTIQCLNREVLRAVDAVLAPDPDAIIVIQADHGLGFGDWSQKPCDEWTATDYRNRYAIWNLIRLPEACADGLYPSFSPVNTFRLVFSCLTGESPALLVDVSYLVNYRENLVEEWHEH